MTVLWIVNIIFPEVLELMGYGGHLKSSGGWLLGAANSLAGNLGKSKLIVATVSPKVNSLKRYDGAYITYYLIPLGKGNLFPNDDYKKYWRDIQKYENPDIVHIHGTEFSHGLAYVEACGSKNVVVSIQGMKSAYYYYYYGLSTWDILKNITLRDIIKGSPIREKHNFKKQSLYEVKLLNKVNHIVGRTSWDKARVWAINPNAKYHFCNETLRSEFYDGSTWSYEKCDRHSLFLSQAGYPIKGLHQVLKAMPLVLRHYPDAKIRIAGPDITRNSGLTGLVHFTTYGRIIKKMLKKYNLEDRVFFTGNLNAEEMKSEYLKANLFISPSTIENSPNSLGEAQILGVPCLASYVGGVMDMMKGAENNLYRFEEVAMLAEKIVNVFDNADKQVLMVQEAKRRHNRITNVEQLIGIYEDIYKHESVN